MATWNIDQVAQFAYNAGFRGESAATIIAIAKCESGFDDQKVGPQGEQGILQVYPLAHPDANYACLRDAQCEFNYCFTTISNSGTNFHPWTTFNNGCYKQWLPESRTAVGKISGTKKLDPCWGGIKDGTPWYNVPACQPWNLSCFDPGQCAAYIQGGLKVSAGSSHPTTSQTGPTQTGQDAANTLLGKLNNLMADPTRLVKGLLGIVLLLVGLALMIKQLVPPGVQKAALAAVGA